MPQTEQPRGVVLELIAKREGADFSQVVDDAANGRRVDLSDWKLVQHISLIDDFRPEFIDYVSRHGMSSLLSREPLFEALVQRGGAVTPAIAVLLNGFLTALRSPTELVIVDGYFLQVGAAERAAYPAFVVQVLQPVLATLTTLTLVTKSSTFDPRLLAAITAALAVAAPSLTVRHKTSDAFHDRFWVDPVASEGFITGTSLNGLGKRYALVDRLQPVDAADVVAALRAEQLL